MSFMYTFENVVVVKSPAFQCYISNRLPSFAGFMVEENLVRVISNVELDSTQLAALDANVRSYTDPAIYYQFEYAETITGFSQSTISNQLEDVQSFIFPSKTLPNGDNAESDGKVFNAIKSILKLTMGDVAQALEFTSGSVTIELYDITRDFQIGIQTIDITPFLLEWKAAALANQTGLVNKYKSFIFSGLDSNGTNYDTIWVFRLSVSEPKVRVRLNGFQKLFYTPL